VFHGCRPHARRLHETEVGARRERDEVARAVERVVLAEARDNGGLRIGREADEIWIGQGRGIEARILGVIRGERFRHQSGPARREIVGDADLGGRGQIARVHRDVARARLLAVGHLRDLENFIRQPHRHIVERDGEAAGETADGRVAVVDKVENAVDRSVGIREVDLAENRADALIAPRVASEHGGQQFGRDLGEVSGGRRRDKGESGDFHACTRRLHGNAQSRQARTGRGAILFQIQPRH